MKKYVLFLAILILFLLILKSVFYSTANSPILLKDISETINGDVNGDGKLNVQDYIMIRKYIMRTGSLTSNQIRIADINGDNEVNVMDYILVRKEILYGNSTVNVTKVTLNKQSVSLNVSEIEKLVATVSPSNATNKSVLWTSNDNSIVSVDQNGKLVGKRVGEAIITVTTNNGKSATCRISVSKINQFEITHFWGINAKYVDNTQINYLKDAGFTIIELADFLSDYNEYRTNIQKALQKLSDNGVRVSVRPRLNWNSEKELYSSLQNAIDDFGNYANIDNYAIIDEPDVTKFDLISKAVNYIQSHDNGRDSYINLLPNYATSNDLYSSLLSQYESSGYMNGYLNTFAQKVNTKVFSVDHYPSMFTDSIDIIGSKQNYYANLLYLLEISRKYNRIPMMIVLVSEHLNFKNLSKEEIAYQVSVSLALGMRRISYFTYSVDGIDKEFQNALIDANHNRTTHYYNVKDINKWAFNLGNQLYNRWIKQLYGFREVNTFNNYDNSVGSIQASQSGILSLFDDNSFLLVNTEILPSPINNTFTFDKLSDIEWFNTNTNKWEKLSSNITTDSFKISYTENKIIVYPGHCILLRRS